MKDEVARIVRRCEFMVEMVTMNKGTVGKDQLKQNCSPCVAGAVVGVAETAVNPGR